MRQAYEVQLLENFKLNNMKQNEFNTKVKQTPFVVQLEKCQEALRNSMQANQQYLLFTQELQTYVHDNLYEYNTSQEVQGHLNHVSQLMRDSKLDDIVFDVDMIAKVRDECAQFLSDLEHGQIHERGTMYQTIGDIGTEDRQNSMPQHVQIQNKMNIDMRANMEMLNDQKQDNRAGMAAGQNKTLNRKKSDKDLRA